MKKVFHNISAPHRQVVLAVPKRLRPYLLYNRALLANVRVSKMGGVVRSLDVLGRTSELGLPVIVGAQVGETSLLRAPGSWRLPRLASRSPARKEPSGLSCWSGTSANHPLCSARVGRSTLMPWALPHGPGSGSTSRPIGPFSNRCDSLVGPLDPTSERPSKRLPCEARRFPVV